MRGKTLAASSQSWGAADMLEGDGHSAASPQAGEAGSQKASHTQPQQTWSSANGNPRCRKHRWGRQPGGRRQQRWTPTTRCVVFTGAQPAGQGKRFYSLFSTCELQLEQSVQFWLPCSKTDTDELAKIQQRTKMRRELQHTEKGLENCVCLAWGREAESLPSTGQSPEPPDLMSVTPTFNGSLDLTTCKRPFQLLLFYSFNGFSFTYLS